MAKGNPNDESMKSNFVAKVWDKTAEEYKPIYTAPDATDEVRGMVYLSDEIDGTDGITDDIRDAAEGVVAATPAAVKKAMENIIPYIITDDYSKVFASTSEEYNQQPNIRLVQILGTTREIREKNLSWINEHIASRVGTSSLWITSDSFSLVGTFLIMKYPGGQMEIDGYNFGANAGYIIFSFEPFMVESSEYDEIRTGDYYSLLNMGRYGGNQYVIQNMGTRLVSENWSGMVPKLPRSGVKEDYYLQGTGQWRTLPIATLEEAMEYLQS